MNRLYIYMTVVLLSLSQIMIAQKTKTDANIIGHVVSGIEHILFATVYIEGTTIGITTDETGHYMLVNLPVGIHTLKVQCLGYKTKSIEVFIKANETKEVNFDLDKDVLGIEEVVVTGNRNETNRKASSVIVNTITPKLFSSTQSVTLSEGLNFSPGLRMENNCQNCGFSQVRMNGMEGPYSQILINSRPIFSGLAGVYGLELIPSNMIERIEVIRGGGSALYGSNAIAGTINLILKDPITNSYEFGLNSGLTGFGIDGSGEIAGDYSTSFNTSMVSADSKTGMALYGFYRERKPFDANNDSFSEIASLKNTTIGTRLYHRFGARSKLSGDFFNIKEDRRGGDKHDYPVHEAGIAEAINHDITTGALTYDQFFRAYDKLSVFVSGQRVNRDSYYGAEQSLKDYGNTKDFSYTAGVQYNAKFDLSSMVVGIENQGAWLTDMKNGYPDLENAVINFADSTISVPHTSNTIIAKQKTNTTGVFAQYEINWNKFQFSAGARFDHYSVSDKEHAGDEKSGNVLSPRLTIKYDIRETLQARLSYSQGYRAPQIFDEDLHIETSGSRKVIHKNDPDLKQENSQSYMASLDLNKKIAGVFVGFLVEGFYTKLNNPFANEYSDADDNGIVVYTRVNAEQGALVKGLNMELNLIPGDKLSFKGGYTIQSSKYAESREFDEKRFFRTPANYGYFTIDWQPVKSFAVSSTGNYTGKMLVPYFGPQIADPDNGELRETGSFFDLGMKIRYTVKLNGASMQMFTGMKNIFNSYQADFDNGINRDPGYVYGPMNPRTIYFGIKIGNFIR